MANVIWSSHEDINDLLNASDDEKINALIVGGYDKEFLDGKDLNELLKGEVSLVFDASERFNKQILPELAPQTYSDMFVAVASDNTVESGYLSDINDYSLNTDKEVALEADANGALSMKEYSDGKLVYDADLYIVPVDNVKFEDAVCQDLIEKGLIFVDDGEDFDLYDELDTELLAEVSPDVYREMGMRLIAPAVYISENINEAKSKSPADLEIELESIKADLNDFGYEGFYAVPFSSFEREYPIFTKEVIKTFLKEMQILSKDELKNPSEWAEYWQTGELITPQDWPCLLEGAGHLVNGGQFQWEKLYKKYYQPSDIKESVTEDLDSDVYDALADVAYDYEVNKEIPVTKEEFEDAEDNFNDKFFTELDD